MNTASGSTVDQDPNMTSSLIARGDNDVGISGVDNKFVNASMFVNAQERFPAAPAVRCPVKPTITTITPQWTLCRDQYFV